MVYSLQGIELKANRPSESYPSVPLLPPPLGRGKLRVVGPSAAQEAERSEEVKLRVAAWQGMSDAARNGFAWPEV